MACKVHVIKWFYFLGQLGCLVVVIEARQQIQVVVELLELLNELPNRNPVGLLQPITDVESLGLCRVTLEDCLEVKGDAVHEGRPQPLTLFSVLDSK